MDARKLVNVSKYLKPVDFDSPTIKARIAGVRVDKVKAPKPGEVLCIIFQEKIKPLIVNGTIMEAVKSIAGSYDTDDWTGKFVELYIDDNVESPKGITSAVRVRARKAYSPKTEEEFTKLLIPARKEEFLDMVSQGILILNEDQLTQIKNL